MTKITGTPKHIIYGTLDMNSRFYRNCKIQRKRKSKCCNDCPFRSGIEQAETNVKLMNMEE